MFLVLTATEHCFTGKREDPDYCAAGRMDGNASSMLADHNTSSDDVTLSAALEMSAAGESRSGPVRPAIVVILISDFKLQFQVSQIWSSPTISEGNMNPER